MLTNSRQESYTLTFQNLLFRRALVYFPGDLQEGGFRLVKASQCTHENPEPLTQTSNLDRTPKKQNPKP